MILYYMLRPTELRKLNVTLSSHNYLVVVISYKVYAVVEKIAMIISNIVISTAKPNIRAFSVVSSQVDSVGIMLFQHETCRIVSEQGTMFEIHHAFCRHHCIISCRLPSWPFARAIFTTRKVFLTQILVISQDSFSCDLLDTHNVFFDASIEIHRHESAAQILIHAFFCLAILLSKITG